MTVSQACTVSSAQSVLQDPVCTRSRDDFAPIKAVCSIHQATCWGVRIVHACRYSRAGQLAREVPLALPDVVLSEWALSASTRAIY